MLYVAVSATYRWRGSRTIGPWLVIHSMCFLTVPVSFFNSFLITEPLTTSILATPIQLFAVSVLIARPMKLLGSDARNLFAQVPSQICCDRPRFFEPCCKLWFFLQSLVFLVIIVEHSSTGGRLLAKSCTRFFWTSLCSA